jgi:curli biogenesis system outer membrane secretion channel CsgG
MRTFAGRVCMKSKAARGLFVMTMIAGLAACTTTVDKASVQATAGAPVATQVDVLKIPYDPALPKYIVTVEPITMGAEGSPGAPAPTAAGGNYGWGPWGLGQWGTQPIPKLYSPPAAGISDRVGNGIAAQLVSGLTNAGNIVVVDYGHYLANRHNPSSLCGSGELGPFVLKGTVTEFTEVAEAGEQSKGASLGWAGTVLGIAGAVAGVPSAGITGAAVSAANPTYQETRMRRTGSVAMDLQIIDPGTGRILGSNVAAGKFTAESATSGMSVFGVGGGESAFAASALGQATRAAVNDAVQQVVQRLTTIRR